MTHLFPTLETTVDRTKHLCRRNNPSSTHSNRPQSFIRQGKYKKYVSNEPLHLKIRHGAIHFSRLVSNAWKNSRTLNRKLFLEAERKEQCLLVPLLLVLLPFTLQLFYFYLFMST